MTGKMTYSQQADAFIKTTSQLMAGDIGRLLLSLSRGEFGVLMYLDGHDEGVTSTMISAALGIGPGGVANVLKALEKKGLVSKLQDQRDRRANSVTITPVGREHLEARYQQIKKSVVAFMKEMGPEQSAALGGSLSALLTVTQASDDAADR